METRNFVMFALNYPHRFIHSVWTGRMADHLQSKFDMYYNYVGSSGVMVKFFCELDTQNQQKLTDFINDYYSQNGSV